jgi:hypothetical protein
MKKITVVFVIMGLLVISGYVYVRTSLTTPGFEPPPGQGAAAQTKPPETVLDLKPKLVQKLQQLVKEGSNGLYNLYVRELKPDIVNSTVRISDASLVPDTAAMKKLETSGQLPDEVFKIETDAITIDGLGINDLFSGDVVNVKVIHIRRPTINVYSRSTSGNRKQEKETLYHRLMNQMKHIGIGKLVIDDGTLITHKAESDKSTRFNDIAVRLSNIVIDSTTQFDKKRFLFARDAQITLKNYAVPTSNNLYTFKVGVVSINATKQLLVARGISLQPHYSKREFQQHTETQKERYDISIPSIVIQNTNWWDLINNQVLQASSADLGTVKASVYLDRRKPSAPTEMKQFPQQIIMKLPMKLRIQKVTVGDLDLVYEEFSKVSKQAGKLYVNNLHGTISNLTNLPNAIKSNHTTTVSASGMFMKTAPVTLSLSFDLTKYQSGAFSAQIESKTTIDGPTINPIAEPLGLFRVKTGELKQLVSHVSGDNRQASGNVTMLYDNLHITPLKADPGNPGELKKKSVTSLIANSFVLKDENPSKDGDVRKEDASFTRKSGTFFNLIWKTTLVGILKTIGAPTKLAAD